MQSNQLDVFVVNLYSVSPKKHRRNNNNNNVNNSLDVVNDCVYWLHSKPPRNNLKRFKKNICSFPWINFNLMDFQTSTEKKFTTKCRHERRFCSFLHIIYSSNQNKKLWETISGCLIHFTVDYIKWNYLKTIESSQLKSKEGCILVVNRRRASNFSEISYTVR